MPELPYTFRYGTKNYFLSRQKAISYFFTADFCDKSFSEKDFLVEFVY